MRILRLFILSIALAGLAPGSLHTAWAVEEGQLVKKDGRWQYVSTEDPGLKYLYLKGIITQEEYEKGLSVVQAKERLQTPNFKIDVNKIEILVPSATRPIPIPDSFQPLKVLYRLYTSIPLTLTSDPTDCVWLGQR